MKDLWYRFMYGLSSTLGIAPIRRHIPTLEQELGAVRSELGDAIEQARNRPRSWRERHPFLNGLTHVFGIFSSGPRSTVPEENFYLVEDAITEAERREREHH